MKAEVNERIAFVKSIIERFWLDYTFLKQGCHCQKLFRSNE